MTRSFAQALYWYNLKKYFFMCWCRIRKGKQVTCFPLNAKHGREIVKDDEALVFLISHRQSCIPMHRELNGSIIFGIVDND